MKTTLVLILGFVTTSVLAQTKSPTPTATPSPTATSFVESKNKWVPPPDITEDSKTVDTNVVAHYSNDASNNPAYALFDLSSVRKLDENEVSATGKVRFIKPFSSSDDMGELELREANISLSEPWIEIRVGRMDLSDILSTTHFFGRYPLMGERRLDGIKVYIPFKFFFGVEDYKSVSSPPTSLSFFYFPSLFSTQNAVIDGSQGFFLGQARMKLDVDDLRIITLFNLGASSSDFYQYSSTSGNLTYSLCGDVNISKNYDLYLEYGVQSAGDVADTSALALGIKLSHLLTLDFFSLDQIIIEAQLPVGNNPNNPFTGGNGINPTLGVLPQQSLYGRVRMRVRSVFINFNITNSMNDFTFARLNQSNINTALPVPIGPGNETDGLEVPLSSTSYNTWTFSTDVGVSF